MSVSRSAPLLLVAAASALIAACQRDAAASAPADAPAPTAPAAAAPPAIPPNLADPALLQRTADALMKQQYGDSFDASQRCWKFTAQLSGGHSEDYCMRAGQPELVELQGRQHLYLAAANVPDAQGYSYGHVSSGLMGAFVFAPDGQGGWALRAGNKQLTSGSNGDCGCQDAQLVRIGAETMAWKFASGGTGQGIAVSNYSLIAPVGDKMLDLSAIPQIAEDDQDSEYTLTIADNDTSKAFFPLRVTKRTQQPGGKTAETEQTVEFDPVRQRYALAGTP